MCVETDIKRMPGCAHDVHVHAFARGFHDKDTDLSRAFAAAASCV